MAVRPLKVILQNEIIAALGTEPASDALLNVYTASVLSSEHHGFAAIAPENWPAAQVFMPNEDFTNPISENISESTYKVDICLYESDELQIDADAAMAEIVSKVRQSLTAYESEVLERVAVCKNQLRIKDVGWVSPMGCQDRMFKLELTYRTFVTNGEELDDGT